MKSYSRQWVTAALLMWSLKAAGAVCSLESVTLSFGRYDPLSSSATSSTGNIAVICSGTTGEIVSYSVALEIPVGATRSMRTLSGRVLNYTLYTKPDYATVWGNGQAGTLPLVDSYALPAPSNVRNYPVYGRMPARQDVSAGVYNDIVNITLNF